MRKAADYAIQNGARPIARTDILERRPEMQRLADDCLDVRVLDPAMGSGHFLVEVVDYVSNRLIDFLNGWSEQPGLGAAGTDARRTSSTRSTRQHVTIDADRLTRVALLKRAVLKRCVYGVDLNAMAVELAKVSLWLDAFTLGAPLSFLDHHLKWGNSLIGARIRRGAAALEGAANAVLRSNKFAGVMLATDLMRQVELSERQHRGAGAAERQPPTATPATTLRRTSACSTCMRRAGSATHASPKRARPTMCGCS